MSNFGFAKGMYTFGMEYLPEKLYSYRIVGQIKKESESNSFLQADYKISQNISAVAGVRATYNSIYGFNLVPKITFMARLDQTALRLSYGFGYRSPTLKELYYYFDHFGMFTLYGNQNLKPEKSQYLGFSIELNQNWISHSVNFYFNRVSDLISNNWIDAKTVQYVNDSSARIYGIDILEKVMPFKNFILSGGASYVDARNIISGRFLYDISPLSANILASYTFHTLHEKTTLEISGKYTAHRQYEPLDSIQLSDKPYNIWRANITQHYKNHFSLTLGIDNIFNTVNSKSFDNISPGRRYFVSINFKFSK
jgi:outer membrane receptor for ferrienterochelin and colicins